MGPRFNGARDAYDDGCGILLRWARSQEKFDLHDHPHVRRLCSREYPVGLDRFLTGIWK